MIFKKNIAIFIIFLVASSLQAQTCISDFYVENDNRKLDDYQKEIIEEYLKKTSLLIESHIDSLNRICPVDFVCDIATRIEYIGDTNKIIIPENYLVNKFFEIFDENYSTYFIKSTKEQFRKVVTHVVTEMYYTIVYEIAHESGHAQINRFLKNYRETEKISEEEIKEVEYKFRSKEEALSDFLAGVYFRQFKLIDSISDMRPEQTYMGYLVEYIFSIGDVDIESYHPLLHQRLSAFVLGSFSESSNFKLPFTESIIGLISFVAVSAVITESKYSADRSSNTPFYNHLNTTERRSVDIARDAEHVAYFTYGYHILNQKSLTLDYYYDSDYYKSQDSISKAQQAEYDKMYPRDESAKYFIMKRVFYFFKEYDDLDDISLTLKYDKYFFIKVKRDDINELLLKQKKDKFVNLERKEAAVAFDFYGKITEN